MKKLKEDLPIKLKDLMSTIKIGTTDTDKRFADKHGLRDGSGSPSVARTISLDVIDTADDIDPGFEAVGGSDESEADEHENQSDSMPTKKSDLSLTNLMKELELPKGKYVKLGTSDVDSTKEELFNLIQTAYASIGGHLKFKSPSDVKDPDLKHWVAADIDADPDIDVVYFGKKTPYGIKHTGIGHDGEKPNIKNLLIRKTKELKTTGNYVELSGGAFNSFVGKGGVPTIDDEDLVRAILGPRRESQTTWHGQHPTKPSMKGNGWYTRTIGGKQTTKTMAGTVK
jgi:hypothetical protein